MSIQSLPGTTIDLDLDSGQDCKKTFEAVFAATGGVFLSQLSELTGIPGPAIQNWVKRGYVSRPQGKRYSKRQTCRIILIALLRHTLQIDDVAGLLSLLNNNLADELDDLVDDTDLYLAFCDVVTRRIKRDSTDDLDRLVSRVAAPIARNNPAFGSADLERLEKVIRIIVLSYDAHKLQQQVQGLWNNMKERRVNE